MYRRFLVFILFCFTLTIQKTFSETNVTSDSIPIKNAPRDSILNCAVQFLGFPYQKGGKGPGRFDCSGYTGYVFSKFGYSLASSSAGQYLQGEKVKPDELQKGDLVFFKGRDINSQAVGHVGIVYEMDTINHTFYFIHAAVQGGVRIDNYSGEYYTNRYIGAKRILPSIHFQNEENPDLNLVYSSDTIKTASQEKNHTVKEGETLYKIAGIYHCSIDELMLWNKLRNNNLKIGQNLKIFSVSKEELIQVY